MPIAPKTLDFAGGRQVPVEEEGDPQYYAGVYGVQAERAAEIDTWVDERVGMLLNQLASVGIQVNQQMAPQPT
jgi:hypothetical protein